MAESPQEPPPYCRICYESYETLPNSLIVPCDCRGSLQHVHRKCLLRWVLSPDRGIAETKCHLCGALYRVDILRRLEEIPSGGNAAELILRMPAILILAFYYMFATLGSLVGVRRIPMVFWATVAHTGIHTAYFTFLVLSVRIRNPWMYIYTAIPYLPVVVGIHWLLYVLYTPQNYEIGYFADLWLGAYWFAHVRILGEINEKLLE